MINNLTKDTYLKLGLVLVVLLFLAAFSFTAWQSLHRWQGQPYFGEISALTADGFKLSDLKVKERLVATSTATMVRRGRQAPAALKVGERVIVVGTPGPAGQINASLIRVVEPGDKRSLNGQ